MRKSLVAFLLFAAFLAAHAASAQHPGSVSGGSSTPSTTYDGPTGSLTPDFGSVARLGWKERLFIRAYLAVHRDKPASQPAPKTLGEIWRNPTPAMNVAYRVLAEHPDATSTERWEMVVKELGLPSWEAQYPGESEGLAYAKQIAYGNARTEEWLTTKQVGSFGLWGAPGY